MNLECRVTLTMTKKSHQFFSVPAPGRQTLGCSYVCSNKFSLKNALIINKCIVTSYCYCCQTNSIPRDISLLTVQNVRKLACMHPILPGIIQYLQTPVMKGKGSSILPNLSFNREREVREMEMRAREDSGSNCCRVGFDLND